ncbi:hypothetical protein ACVGW2_00300, partial [Enterobacter intestinihominis]
PPPPPRFFLQQHAPNRDSTACLVGSDFCIRDTASFVVVDASCSAEAVGLISPRTATFHKGNLVWGSVG